MRGPTTLCPSSLALAMLLVLGGEKAQASSV
jgi:hypothetical protein